MDRASEGLGVMFEGDSADTCADFFLMVLMGCLAEGLACSDPEARTPIGASGNFSNPNVISLGHLGDKKMGGIYPKPPSVSYKQPRPLNQIMVRSNY